MRKGRLVQVGEYGRRCGEDHGRAKLTDHEVELVRQLKEGGMSAAEIAEKMEITVRYVYILATFARRACAVVQYRKMKKGKSK